MSTLSSSSTPIEIDAAYADNASYREDGNAAKAGAFVTACIFILRLPETVEVNGHVLSWSHALVRQEKQDAERWLAMNDTNVRRVTHVDFRSYRE